jgi:hypothetical protein
MARRRLPAARRVLAAVALKRDAPRSVPGDDEHLVAPRICQGRDQVLVLSVRVSKNP